MKAYDYRELRLNNLTQPKFRHILLLLYWPLYGLAFLATERFFRFNYNIIECALDRRIPFCEFFIIPYCFWFFYIVWMLVYSFFFDVDIFKKFSWFVIITYTVAVISYFAYPSMQQLRPTEFARQNIFTELTGALYTIDTNTNICPSVHVLGSMAVTFAGLHSKRYSTTAWKIAFGITNILIILSTVFLKQHSVIDVVLALVLSFAVYPFVFLRKKNQ